MFKKVIEWCKSVFTKDNVTRQRRSCGRLCSWCTPWCASQSRGRVRQGTRGDLGGIDGFGCKANVLARSK